MKCKIVFVGKRRDGGGRYWCVKHHANATAKYGVAANYCVAAHDVPISDSESLDLSSEEFAGGIALWGSVPAVFDTTNQPTDRGIHLHARRELEGIKEIDKTYRRLRVACRTDLLSDGWVVVDEVDAINYMVSRVFGFRTTEIRCSKCGFSHLDRDWFAVHPHKRHQCHGCGLQFSDTVTGIGNPLAYLQERFSLHKRQEQPSKLKTKIKQRDYPGGIQIWGSNPAIVWTASHSEAVGIHLHCFDSLTDQTPSLDDTFGLVEIDGVSLDPIQVRYYMAQSAMPHLQGRIVSLVCPKCETEHFDQNEWAYTPHIKHTCEGCGATFCASTQLKKVIGNPFVEVRRKLAVTAPNALRHDVLNLRPETI